MHAATREGRTKYAIGVVAREVFGAVIAVATPTALSTSSGSIDIDRSPARAKRIPYYTYLKRMKSPKSANCAGQFLEVGARKTKEVGATQIRKSIFASELVESSLLHTL